MVTHIRQLLYKHDCVVVPGLGAFIANYQPARVQLFDEKIYPPSKSIAFNRALKQNDGLLIMQVAQQESISYKAAEEQVNAFSRHCLAALEKHRSFLLNDIGRLYFDNDNNLLFEPADRINFLIDAHSLPVLSLQPVERLKHGATIESSRPHIENDRDVEALLAEIEADHQRSHKRSNIPYWIAFILVIGFLSTIVGVSLQQNDLGRIGYSSFFPDFKALTLKPAAKVKAPEIRVEPEVVVPAPVTPVPEVSAPLETAPAPVSEAVLPEPAAAPANLVEVPKAYIVVGAFLDQQYAEKAKAEASENGFRTVQLDEYDGTLHRVMVESDIQRVDSDLAVVKSSLNTRAWVFCTNCSY